jgi:hypothetical protein
MIRIVANSLARGLAFRPLFAFAEEKKAQQDRGNKITASFTDKAVE